MDAGQVQDMHMYLVPDIALTIIGAVTKALMVESVRLIAQAAEVLFTYR